MIFGDILKYGFYYENSVLVIESNNSEFRYFFLIKYVN